MGLSKWGGEFRSRVKKGKGLLKWGGRENRGLGVVENWEGGEDRILVVGNLEGRGIRGLGVVG